MKKYVLFGAGYYGEIAIQYLEEHNIEFIVDNASEKDGSFLKGIPVFLFDKKKKELCDYNIVISISPKRYGEIEEQLKKEGIDNYITLQEQERSMIKDRMVESANHLNIYKNAVEWIYNNSLPCGAIINNTGQPYAYPEVTGYYIPSLLYWGHRQLALGYAKWLCSIQKEDGSWYDTDDKEPFIFDTAQILKGLLAVRDIDHSFDDNIIHGCEWIVSRMEKDGRIPAVNPETWGDGKTLSELIHIYCLSPIKEAGVLFDRKDLVEKAETSLNYYITNFGERIKDFHLLSHFYAYVIEGLVDMGCRELAKEVMSRIAELQRESGAVPAYKDVNWVCSTGLFQFAVIWYKLGDYEHGEKAFEYACKLQNPSGGWYGSYPPEDGEYELPKYFSHSEISWAVKYFLDALLYRNICVFNQHSEFFIDDIDVNSTAYQVFYSEIKDDIHANNKAKILDVGCGKGGHLRNLYNSFPLADYYAIDITDKTLSQIDSSRVKTKIGSLTYIPYEEDYFDIVYTCEALEHAVDIKMAIKEIARVIKPGGKVIIIDKYLESQDRYLIEKWEQFFDEEELKEELLQYFDNVNVTHGIGHNNETLTMSAWIGRKKVKL